MWMLPFCGLLASFSLECGIAGAVLWGDGVRCLVGFCLVCLGFSGLLKVGGWVVLGFGFHCCGGSDRSN